MDAHSLDRIGRYVALAGALLTAIAFALGGSWMGVGAIVGALVALGNWYALRWLGKQLIKANDKGKMIWSTLLALKMSAILGVVWLILSTGLVDPIGFAVGMTALVAGALAGGLHSSLTTGSTEPASEEG